MRREGDRHYGMSDCQRLWRIHHYPHPKKQEQRKKDDDMCLQDMADGVERSPCDTDNPLVSSQAGV